MWLWAGRIFGMRRWVLNAAILGVVGLHSRLCSRLCLPCTVLPEPMLVECVLEASKEGMETSVEVSLHMPGRCRPSRTSDAVTIIDIGGYDAGPMSSENA